MTVTEERQAATTGSDRAFKVEQHGIDFIPEAERWAKPRDLFGMWAGASFQIEYFVYGVILMTFGLSFTQAVWITIVGNLSFVLLGLTSLQGPDAGTTTMMINRASFGQNGSRVISLFNWATQVGFETEGLILVVFAAEVLAHKAGFLPGTPAKVIFILAAVGIQLLLPLFGHATVVKTLRALILPFFVLFALLAGLTLSKVHVASYSHGGSWQLVMVGLAFTIALSGLGWTENGNDYSRYLPRNASRKAIVGWVTLGTAVPEILVMLLGVAVGTYASGIATNQNPFAAFIGAKPVVSTWFVVPFLVVSLFQLFAINSLDLYSSGVTLQAVGVRVRRWQAVVIDTAIACGITFYAIFSSSFFNLLKDFVTGVICWIAPWMAIYLVDWLLRRFRHDPVELQRTGPGSLYWRSGGIHWPAIIAQALGIFVAIESVSQLFFVGQISRWIGADKIGVYPDFSIFFSVVVAGLVYYVLARKGVHREAERQVEPLGTL
ncbi:MAG TPA: cytosine permease [Acidimicrobiales bacterium]|nr:cytosine permease [Acidimicrobiales bacterium]